MGAPGLLSDAEVFGTATTTPANPQGFGLYADPAMDPSRVATKGLPTPGAPVAAPAQKLLSDDEVFGKSAWPKLLSDEEVFGAKPAPFMPKYAPGEQALDSVKSGVGGAVDAVREAFAQAPETASATFSGVGAMAAAGQQKLDAYAHDFLEPALGTSPGAEKLIESATPQALDYVAQSAPDTAAYIKRGADVIAPAAKDQNIATKTIGTVANFLELGAAGKIAPVVMGLIGAGQAGEQADTAKVVGADRSDAVLTAMGINTLGGQEQMANLFSKMEPGAQATILKQLKDMGLSGVENALIGRGIDAADNANTQANINSNQQIVRPLDAEDAANAAAGAIVHGAHMAGEARVDQEPYTEQPQEKPAAVPTEKQGAPTEQAAKTGAAPEIAPDHADLLQRSLVDVEQQIPQSQGADLAELQQRRLALQEALGKPQGELDDDVQAEPDQGALDAKDAAARAALTKPTKLMTPDEKDAALDTDPLTLLPNRRAFMAKEQEQPAGAYSAIDLVGFKNINDTLGHDAGDEVLKAWGQTLRQSGVDAARTGGDEFTVRGDNPEQLETVMQSLKDKVGSRQITVQAPDGKTRKVGLDFRYGIGETPRAADEAQIRTRTPGQQARGEGAGQNLDGTSGDGGEALPGRQLPGADASADQRAPDAGAEAGATDSADGQDNPAQAAPAEDLDGPPYRGGPRHVDDSTAQQAAPKTGGPRRAAPAEAESAVDAQNEVAPKQQALFSLKDKDAESAGSRHNKIVNASIAFGRSVDEINKTGPTRAGKVDMGPTPDVLLKTGAKDLPLRIDPDVIRKAFSKHDIPPATLKLIPRALHEPVMVFDSKVRGDSKVVLTDLKDSKGRSIAVSVHLDTKEGRNDINDITSVHGRAHAGGIIDWIKDGLLRYRDKEKSQKWSQSGGFNMPAEETTPSPGKKVLSEADIVKPFTQPTSGKGPRFSHAGEPAAGVRADAAQKFAKPLMDFWSNNGGPRIHIVQGEADVPREHQQEITSQNASGQVEGFYDPATKEVWVIADNLDSPKDVVRVLMHEVRGHYQLRQVFGDGVTHILDRTLMTYGKKGLQDIVEKYGLDWNNREDRLVAAEEKIAHIAETGEHPGILQAIIAHVREFLRKLFPDLKYSDAEIRKMVLDMNKPLDEGTEEQGGEPVPAGARFSLRDDREDEPKTVSGKVSDLADRARQLFIDKTPDPVKDFLLRAKSSEPAQYAKKVGKGAVEFAAPLGASTPEAAAIAKRYANFKSENLARLHDADQMLKDKFTPEQRARMWQATSNENVAKVFGTKPTDGFDSLSPDERKVAMDLQKENSELVPLLLEDGVLKHAFQIWDPRYLAGVAKEKGGSSVLNPMGHDLRLTTKRAQDRLHVTAEETEQAAKAIYGDEAHLIKDIRILPFAMHELRNVLADKSLIKELKAYGDDNGVELVVPTDKLNQDAYKSYKTIDAPAFREWTPKYVEENGTMRVLRDDRGQVVREAKQLHIHPDLEGPLKAVLRQNDANVVTKFLMAIKSKAMGTIVGMFPPVHRSVVFFKTVFAAPSAMMTGRLQALGEELRTANPDIGSFKSRLVNLGRTGEIREGMDTPEALAKEKFQAVKDGLRDVSFRQWAGSVDDIERDPKIDEKAGKSWTAQMLGLGARIAGTPTGKGEDWSNNVKAAVDTAGEYWHSRWMWEKVANTQYGLYRMVKADLIEKGMTADGAGKEAAQVANRFVGSIPREDMGQGVRTVLNLSLFSRSFTMSNIGIYKDAMVGLPNAIRGQLNEADLKIGKSYYKRKAAGVLVKDITSMMIMNAAAQSAISWWRGKETGDQILQGYKDRFEEWWQKAHYNPAELLASVNRLTPNSRNEPGKEEYIYLGRDAQGTGMYLKNTFGKIGFDLLSAVSSPNQFLHRKDSTLLGPALQIFNNDKGYGRQIYDPQADGLGGAFDNIMRVIAYFAEAQGPTDLVKGAADLATGADRTPVNIGKTAGAPFGLFFSKGAPGGPAVGFMYAAEKEHEFQVQQVLPDAREAILNGDNQQAVKLMRSANMGGKEILSAFKSTLAPGGALNEDRIREVIQYMTPEERQEFQDALHQR